MSSKFDEVYQFDDPQFDDIKCNQKDNICLTVCKHKFFSGKILFSYFRFKESEINLVEKIVEKKELKESSNTCVQYSSSDSEIN